MIPWEEIVQEPTFALDVDYVFMRARPGAILDECKRWAMVYALTNRVKVLFEHNGKRYSIYYNDVIHNCTKELK